MALSAGRTISITGAGNATTGFSVLSYVSLNLSAAGTINLRETSGAGTIIAQKVLAAAGDWNFDFGDGVRCLSGVFFVENTAGNVSGGVAGY